MKFLQRLVAWAWIGVLLSCGGGLELATGNGGGVGTGGTGIVAGTLTGLGSVIVDGVRYDDSHALIERRADLVRSESLGLADLQLGQYVYLELDAAGDPARIRIESQLVGPAADVNPAAGRFSVWGQPVIVNSDPGQGPVTVLSGYQSLSDLHPADPVQVYGVLQSGASGSDTIRATRIERLASAAAVPARVTGVLQAGPQGALLLAQRPLDISTAPSAPALAAGVAVTAIIPAGAAAPPQWQATSVALVARAATGPVRVSGAAHLLASGHVMVQGIEFDLSQIAAAARQLVHEGGYVTVTGSDSGSGARQLIAAAVEVLPQAGRPAQLRGSITSVAGAMSFVVRGQRVDASAAQFSGGSPASLVVGAFVDIQGVQTPTGVVASSVTIYPAAPDRAVVDITGTVQGVDLANHAIRVQTSDGRTLDLLLAPDVALPMRGETIHATGYWSGGRLQVRDFGR